MNPRAFALTFLTASSGLAWVARWMLVLLLAADLIGSPFHAHHHDVGPGSYSTHTSHAIEHPASDSSSLDEFALHVDSDEIVKHGGHSLSALRGAAIQVANPQAWIELHAIAPSLVFASLFTPLLVEVLPVLRPARERVPIPSFRTVPPNGRAPPALSV